MSIPKYDGLTSQEAQDIIKIVDGLLYILADAVHNGDKGLSNTFRGIRVNKAKQLRLQLAELV